MGDEREDEKRLTRLETRMDGIEQILVRMDAKLDAWNETFVPRKENDAKFETVYTRIKALENSQKTKTLNSPFWVTAAIAFGALMWDVWPKK